MKSSKVWQNESFKKGSPEFAIKGPAVMWIRLLNSPSRAITSDEFIWEVP